MRINFGTRLLELKHRWLGSETLGKSVNTRSLALVEGEGTDSGIDTGTI